MASLKQLFDSAPKRYAELSASVASRTARTEWGTFDRYSLEPFYFERLRYGRGKLVKQPVIDPKGLFEHVFDAEDRLILVRSYNELKPRAASKPGEFIQRPCTRKFYEYFEDHVDSILFDYSAHDAVINVARYRFSGEHLVDVTRRFKNGKQSGAEFVWEGELLRRVNVNDSNGEHADEFSYDVAGQLTRIEWVYASGERSETYRRVTQPLKPLLTQVEARLLSAVEERLAAQHLNRPVAAVALWLNLEGYEHVLPPGLAILSETERTELLAKHPQDPTPFLWNPVEWTGFEAPELELRSEPLQQLCTAANQLLWQGSKYEGAVKLVDNVCKALNKRLPELLRVTDDCVAFPVDICSGDGAAGALRVSSAKQRKLLAQRPLLVAP